MDWILGDRRGEERREKQVTSPRSRGAIGEALECRRHRDRILGRRWGTGAAARNCNPIQSIIMNSFKRDMRRRRKKKNETISVWLRRFDKWQMTRKLRNNNNNNSVQSNKQKQKQTDRRVNEWIKGKRGELRERRVGRRVEGCARRPGRGAWRAARWANRPIQQQPTILLPTAAALLLHLPPVAAPLSNRHRHCWCWCWTTQPHLLHWGSPCKSVRCSERSSPSLLQSSANKQTNN